MPPKAQVDPASLDDSPAAVQQRANTASIAEFELPKTTLAKLAKGSVREARISVMRRAHDYV